MLNLNDLYVFVTAAESKSFSEAIVSSCNPTSSIFRDS